MAGDQQLGPDRQHQRGDDDPATTPSRARPRRPARAPASRSTRSGAIPPGNASSADASGAFPPRRTAASSAASSASACSRRASVRQRVGIADRARDQDAQRVAAVGVMALVRDDRRELGRAQRRQRARGDVHARAQEPGAERARLAPGTTRHVRPPISRVPTTGSAAATRRCAATPRHSERPPCSSAKESNRISAISSSSGRDGTAGAARRTARAAAGRCGTADRRRRTAGPAGTR